MWDILNQLVDVNAPQGGPDFRLGGLGERSVSGNDKLFLPLQAADLYAWHVRRSLSPNKVLHPASGMVMRDLEAIRTISRHVDEPRLVRFRNHMERGATQFAAKNPGVELVAYQGTAAQQRAARVAAQAGTKKHPPVPLTPAAKASD